MKGLRIGQTFVFLALSVFMLSTFLMPATAPAGEKITVNPDTLKQLFKKKIQINPGALKDKLYLFKFDVPVDIKKVHQDVTKAVVGCIVSDLSNPLGALWGAGEHGGIGITEIPLNKEGAYKGNVTVLITNMRRGDPAGVSYWSCLLVFEVKGSETLHIPLSGEGEMAPYGPAPGTTPTVIVEGTFGQ